MTEIPGRFIEALKQGFVWYRKNGMEKKVCVAFIGKTSAIICAKRGDGTFATKPVRLENYGFEWALTKGEFIN